MIQKLENKFGHIKMPSFVLIFTIIYGVGNLLYYIWPTAIEYLCFDPYRIVKMGQVWRIFTFVLYPNSSSLLMILITCFIYYSMGKSLEQVLGRFRLNFFLITGWFWLVIFGFLYYFFFGFISGFPAIANGYASMLNMYCLLSSMFTLFAFIYPNAQFLFLFFIPIRGKFMILITAGLYLVDIISLIVAGQIGYMWILVFMILAAIVNLCLFFLLGGKQSFASSYKTKTRKKPIKIVNERKSSATSSDTVRHKCCVCGRTSETNPELQFRYCSKCIGLFEYCEEHLYTHEHMKPKGME